MTQTRRQFAYLAHLRNLATVAAAIADGDMPTAPELAALVGVDERTIYRYLTTLREFGAPLPVPATATATGSRGDGTSAGRFCAG